MYKTFYKLKGIPFSDSTNPECFYLSEQHRKALALLTQGLENGPSANLFCGDPGTGKTITCRQLMKQEENAITFGFLANKNVSHKNLLQSILFAFGLNGRDKNEAEHKDVLHDFIINECYKKNRPPTLIVDDSDQLDARTLSEIITLPFMESPESGKSLKVILVGQSGLLETLNHLPLDQSPGYIETTVKLMPLNQGETHNYIRHRLKIAGAQSSPLLADKAGAAVYKHSRGNPSLINKLCSAALVYGFTKEESTIDAALIDTVADDEHQSDPNSALTQDPKNHFSLMVSAQHSIEQGDTETAEQYLLQALKLRPNASNIRLALEDLVQTTKKPITVSEFIVSDVNGCQQESERKAQSPSASFGKAAVPNDRPLGVLFSKDWHPIAILPVVITLGMLLAVFVHYSNLDSNADQSPYKPSSTHQAKSTFGLTPDSIKGSANRSIRPAIAASSETDAEQPAPPSDSLLVPPVSADSAVTQEQLLSEQTIIEQPASDTTSSLAKVELTPPPVDKPSDKVSTAEDSDMPEEKLFSASANPSLGKSESIREENATAPAAPLVETTKRTQAVAYNEQQQPLDGLNHSISQIEFTAYEVFTDNQHQTVAIRAKVSGPIVMMKVFLRTDKGFEPYIMYDDRTHGDPISNDGEFHAGISLNRLKINNIRYYIAAYTKNGEVLYDPANAGETAYSVNLSAPY